MLKCEIYLIFFRCANIWSVSNIVYSHWGRVTHICVSNLTITGSGNGLSPSHYLNQCWNIINWTFRNKLQWKFNQNSNIFIQENAFESVVCEMAAMLSWPQSVKKNIVPPTTDTPVMEHFTPSGTSLKVPNHNIPGVLWRWDDLLTVLCPKWKSETYQTFNIELDELTAHRQQKSVTIW